jgi:glutamyl-tRNA synthetase
MENIAGFFWNDPEVDKSLFGENYKEHLDFAVMVIESLKDWNLETLNEKLMEGIKEKGFKVGDFFMTLRIAITGVKFTPPINDSIVILGKEETLTRLGRVV